MSGIGEKLALEFEEARDAVIDAKIELERAERRLAEAGDKMLAYIEARIRHPSTRSITGTNA